jgi:DNA polymerase
MHPTTRLLSLVAMHANSRKIVLWVPSGRAPEKLREYNRGEFWPKDFPNQLDYEIVTRFTAEVPSEIRDWQQKGHTFVAHNAAGFDAQAFHCLVDDQTPMTWFDTLPCAKAGAYPGDLDSLAKRLTGRGKDQGKDALKFLWAAKVTRSGEVAYPVGTAPLWLLMLRYNVADVLHLETIFHAVRDYGEADVLAAHQEINERGIAFDRGFLTHFYNLWLDAEVSAGDELARVTGGWLTLNDVKSPVKVKKYLEVICGLKLHSLARDQMERLYVDPEEFFGEIDEGNELAAKQVEHAITVLKLRQAASRTGKGKLDRMFQLADSDDRIRNLLVYYGAHTGRFSGRGLQPHNFPRGRNEVDVEGLFTAYERGQLSSGRLRDEADRVTQTHSDKPPCSVDDVLSTLVRSIFCGDNLTIVDYGQVEARAVAWLADETKLLETFADPTADVYCAMASKVFGRPVTKKDKAERQVGKIVVLGCGYGMGAPKFDITARKLGADLTAAGVTALQCVDAYRSAYPEIAGRFQGTFRRGGLWQDYAQAARNAIRNGHAAAGKCRFRYSEGCLLVRLPSGRELIYRNARIEDRIPPYAFLLGLALDPKPTILYDHVHGYEKQLYGGLLTENIDQAHCRDLMATALVRCRAESIPVVMHVHDEIVTEGDHLERLSEIMSTAPKWAKGFPLLVEGFTCPRYTKAAWKESRKLEMMLGVKIK